MDRLAAMSSQTAIEHNTHVTGRSGETGAATEDKTSRMRGDARRKKMPIGFMQNMSANMSKTREKITSRSFKKH